ncbi:MAG: MFS transporter [Pseudomonadota bacterium]
MNRPHPAWPVLATATLVVFGSLGLARFGYSILLPSMQRGLGMDNTQAGVLATANLVGYLVFSVLGGALASRFGPRKVIFAGLSTAGLGMVLTGLAPDAFWAGVWRLVTGLGSGASNVPVMGLMAAWFAGSRRGFAAGVAVSGSSLALILLGPLVPRLLTATGPDGWRLCWEIFGAAALGLAILSFLVLRDNPGQRGAKPLGQDPPRTAPPADPSIYRSVYRSPRVWHLGAVYVAFGFSYIIYMTFFVKRLMADGGYSREAAGNLFMLLGWCSVFCGLLWGTVSDKIGRKRALVLVYLIHALSFGLFAAWPAPPGFILSAILFGLSAWSIPAIMAAACGDVLGPVLAPAALGFITLFFGIGQALGPVVAGAMADAAGSFTPAFVLAAGVALSGAVMAAFIRR